VDACPENIGFHATTAIPNGHLKPAVYALNAAVEAWKKTNVSSSTDSKTNYPIVLVTWADAHCGDQGWLELEHIEDDGEMLVSTVGYLIPAGEGGKEGHLTILQTYSDGEGIHPFYIPIGMVRDTKLLT